MPIVSEKQDLSSWEKWQKHLNKKFGIEEKEEQAEAQEQALLEENPKAEEEIVSLEFLEKPVE